MNIFKSAIWLTAAYGAYRLLTDKDPITGQTLIQSYGNRLVATVDKASNIKQELTDEFEQLTAEVKTATTKKRGNRSSTESAGVDPTLGNAMI